MQTLSLFLAAVGLMVGLGQKSRSVGALLLLIGAGLWILDLRNRALLRAYRSIGMMVEQRMRGLPRLAAMVKGLAGRQGWAEIAVAVRDLAW